MEEDIFYDEFNAIVQRALASSALGKNVSKKDDVATHKDGKYQTRFSFNERKLPLILRAIAKCALRVDPILSPELSENLSIGVCIGPVHYMDEVVKKTDLRRLVIDVDKEMTDREIDEFMQHAQRCATEFFLPEVPRNDKNGPLWTPEEEPLGGDFDPFDPFLAVVFQSPKKTTRNGRTTVVLQTKIHVAWVYINVTYPSLSDFLRSLISAMPHMKDFLDLRQAVNGYLRMPFCDKCERVNGIARPANRPLRPHSLWNAQGECMYTIDYYEQTYPYMGRRRLQPMDFLRIGCMRTMFSKDDRETRRVDVGEALRTERLENMDEQLVGTRWLRNVEPIPKNISELEEELERNPRKNEKEVVVETVIRFCNRFFARLFFSGGENCIALVLISVDGKRTLHITSLQKLVRGYCNGWNVSWIEFVGEGEHQREKVVKNNVVKIWMDYPQDPSINIFRGLTFEPSDSNIGAELNLWTGYALPKEEANQRKVLVGEMFSLADVLAHVYNVFCEADDERYLYVMRWMAFAVQKPAQKPDVALLLHQPEGTGKNLILGSLLKRVFGRHYYEVQGAHEFLGNFNGHLMGVVALVVGETPNLVKDTYNRFKHYVTGERISIEKKHQDIIEYNNCLHILLFTNHEIEVDASETMRRIFCAKSDASLFRSIDKSQTVIYFKHLANYLEFGGGYEALAWYLYNIDISDFNPRIFPASEWLSSRKERALSPIKLWWVQRLRSGTFDDAMIEAWPRQHGELRIQASRIYENFCRWLSNQRVRGEVNEVTFFRELNPVAPFTRRVEQKGFEQVVYIVFPNLRRCRDIARLKLPDINVDGEDIHTVNLDERLANPPKNLSDLNWQTPPNLVPETNLKCCGFAFREPTPLRALRERRNVLEESLCERVREMCRRMRAGQDDGLERRKRGSTEIDPDEDEEGPPLAKRVRTRDGDTSVDSFVSPDPEESEDEEQFFGDAFGQKWY